METTKPSPRVLSNQLFAVLTKSRSQSSTWHPNLGLCGWVKGIASVKIVSVSKAKHGK